MTVTLREELFSIYRPRFYFERAKTVLAFDDGWLSRLLFYLSFFLYLPHEKNIFYHKGD